MSVPSANRRTKLTSRPSPAESPPDERESDEKSSRFDLTELFTWGLLTVSLSIWAVVGMFLWLPRLVRSGVLFSVALVHGAIVDRSMDPAVNRLRSDVDFYRRGFARALRSARETRGGGSEEDWDITASPLLAELAWALVIWYPVLLWLGIAEMTPVEIWTAVANLPWMETLERIGDTIAAALENIRGALVRGLIG